MTRYVIRRLMQAIPLLFIVSLILFVLVNNIGDPLATMGGRNPLDNGQPQSGSPTLTGARAIGTIKTIKNVGQLFRRDPLTTVGHSQTQLLILHLNVDGHTIPGRGMPQCIGNQVIEQLAQPASIGR